MANVYISTPNTLNAHTANNLLVAALQKELQPEQLIRLRPAIATITKMNLENANLMDLTVSKFDSFRDTLDDLRVYVAYLKLDVEATRRERDALRDKYEPT